MSIQPGSSKLAGRHSVPEIQKKQKSQIKKILLQLLNYQGALSVGYHRQYSFYRRRLFTAYQLFLEVGLVRAVSVKLVGLSKIWINGQIRS